MSSLPPGEWREATVTASVSSRGQEVRLSLTVFIIPVAGRCRSRGRCWWVRGARVRCFAGCLSGGRWWSGKAPNVSGCGRGRRSGAGAGGVRRRSRGGGGGLGGGVGGGLLVRGCGRGRARG